MGLRSILILAVLALASCGGGNPPAARSAPPAPEDIAAGNTVPDEAEPPSGEPSATSAPAGAASNEANASAPTSARFQLGKHYTRLSPAQPTSSSPDKVEVAEIFWYGCPHCYALDPSVKSWVAGKPEYVSFVRVPVVWSDVTKTHARAFYTAEALGKVDAMHDALFREIHDNRDLLDTEDKLRAFFGTFGVDAATFQSAYESAGVQTKVQRADELGRRYRVASVPTLVVNGKYVTDAEMAGGVEQLFALVGELAASEHAGK